MPTETKGTHNTRCCKQTSNSNSKDAIYKYHKSSSFCRIWHFHD